MFSSATSAKLQEIGPRFTLKLRWLRKGLPSVTAPDGHASIGGDPADEIYGATVGPSSEEIAQDELDEEKEALKEIGQPAKKKNVHEGTEVPPLDEEQEYEWKWKVSCSSLKKACYVWILMVRLVAEDGSIEENLLFVMQNWSSYHSSDSGQLPVQDSRVVQRHLTIMISIDNPEAASHRLIYAFRAMATRDRRDSQIIYGGDNKDTIRLLWGHHLLVHVQLDTLCMDTNLISRYFILCYAHSTITLWAFTAVAKGPSWWDSTPTLNVTLDALARWLLLSSERNSARTLLHLTRQFHFHCSSFCFSLELSNLQCLYTLDISHCYQAWIFRLWHLWFQQRRDLLISTTSFSMLTTCRTGVTNWVRKISFRRLGNRM